ncbi:TRAP transporter small permease [Shewanella chilikensis]|uniref:TRAP transporter small permease n=1 Tax=Shewanella chilikensis TaxID=558541 RepID=UPI003A971FD2
MNSLPRLSFHLARLELRCAGVMLAIVLCLLIFNIFTRAAAQAQYWVDEAAITTMVWMTFLAASACLQARSNIAMTLVQDLVPDFLQRLMSVVVDLLMLIFVSFFLVMVWKWFDLLGLYENQWDIMAFSADTFNFIYEEPTQTLGIRKFWVWLILPVFSFTSVLHCLACLQTSVQVLLLNRKPATQYEAS